MWSRSFPILLMSFALGFLVTAASAQEISFIRHDINTNLQAAYGLYVVDVNEDSLPDILTASNDGVKWWKNQGSGVFQSSNVGNLTGAWWVYATDINADGDNDIMAASPHPAADQIRLWVSTSNTSWDAPIPFPLTEAEAVHAAQLDSDEPLEIIGVSWAEDLNNPGNDLVYYKNFLDGDTTHTKIFIDANLSGAHTAVTHDFNNDKKLDVIASGDRRINYYRNLGGGDFSSANSILSTEGSLGLSLADVNLDGNMDIVCQGRTTQRVYWFENTGGFNFTRHAIADSIGESWSVHASDLDGDGDMDISAASQDLDVIRAYINDGFFNFTEVTVAENFFGARMEYPMDVDQDGDMDLIGVASDASTLAWFESVPLPPSLTLTSPNGGESWAAGSSQNITWSSTGSVNAVKIELSTDGGVNWGIIAASETNDGTYLWTVSDASSSLCKIRISSVANPAVTDESDANFTIITPTLTLTKPNGGEQWLIGSVQAITWADNSGLNSVKIELSTNGGATYSIIAANAPNNGSYAWAVPNSPSSTCRIRISDPADGNPVDTGNGDFTITNPALILTAPNGGETWYTGTQQNITWNTVGSISTIKLEFSTNNGTSWQTIVASLANGGSYGWMIPSNPSSTCLVRITDVNDATRTDASNAVFTIALQSIVVTFPNGGQTLILGGTQNLTWTSGGPTSLVNVELSRNGGNTWETLASNFANTGTFQWLVSGTPSTNCLLRVSDAVDGVPSDMSNAAFSIAELAISLIAPNGDELWSYNISYAIQWSTNGAVAGIRLEYSIDNGANWTLITPNAPNTGAYNWAVPQNLSDNCLVRVSDSADGSPFDVSDAVFRIVPPNRMPVAQVGGPYAAPRHVSINFSATQSSDPDNDPLTFTWEFSDGQLMNGAQISRSFAYVQIYSVTLKVADNRGGESFAYADVDIYNQSPTAQAGGPYNTKPGNAIDFNGDASTDPDGDVIMYLWDFGDGSPLFTGGPEVSHLYADLGNYQVVLKVQDDFEGVDSDTTLAIISNNLFPLVELRASEVNVIGTCTDEYEIDFTVDVANDPDGSIVSFDWDFGDNSPHSNSSTTISHIYQVPGAYMVKLSVADNEGAVSVDSLLITLTADHSPVAAFSLPADSVKVDTQVNFDASASTDVDGGIVTYAWNFGDGSVFTSSQPMATHTYHSTGAYSVQLTASDGCGKIGTVAHDLRVVLVTSVSDRAGGVPLGFNLAQNFPNPISLRNMQAQQTRIAFNVPKTVGLELTIYNIFGQRVRRLVGGLHAPGGYVTNWDLRDDKGELVSTGIYFYRLQAGNYLATKKLVITK